MVGEGVDVDGDLVFIGEVFVCVVVVCWKGGEVLLCFGVVYLFFGYVYELCYWLVVVGLELDKDVEIIVLVL